MEVSTQTIPVKLDNDVVIRIEARVIGELPAEAQEGKEIESDVSLNIQPLKEVGDAIEGIAKTIKGSLEQVKPNKATVEFGLEFGYESGQITAILVKGTGKTNLKITLEWVEGEER